MGISSHCIFSTTNTPLNKTPIQFLGETTAEYTQSSTWRVQVMFLRGSSTHVSNEKNLDWLGYVGDYTTQLYWD